MGNPATDGSQSAEDERLRCAGCGKIHPWARLVKLPDGREVGTDSEDFRRYCEAKWALRRYRSKNTRIRYLDLVEEKRGAKAREELRAEMLKIWEAKR